MMNFTLQYSKKNHNDLMLFYAILCVFHWAIPGIRCTPRKEDMGIPQILTTFFIGKSPQIKHFFGCKGEENMGIPKIFNHI